MPQAIHISFASAAAMLFAAVTAYAAGGAVSGPVAGPPAGQQVPTRSDTAAPQTPKSPLGTPDTATGANAAEAPVPTAPGTDTSTAAPGGQAESTKSGTVGTVPQRHHGPKRPTHKPTGADDGTPPPDGTPK